MKRIQLVSSFSSAAPDNGKRLKISNLVEVAFSPVASTPTATDSAAEKGNAAVRAQALPTVCTSESTAPNPINTTAPSHIHAFDLKDKTMAGQAHGQAQSSFEDYNPPAIAAEALPTAVNNTDQILNVLSKLKMGDYWKHLPRELWHLEGGNKENRNSDDDEINDDDDDDDDHDQDDSGSSTLQADPFCCRVLSGGTLVSCEENKDVGFVVTKVTKEGWICVPHEPPAHPVVFGLSKTCHDEYDDVHDDDGDNDEGCCLLRLPFKVARLGQAGMIVMGIDLWERCDNGVLEPRNASSSRRRENENRLVGNIQL